MQLIEQTPTLAFAPFRSQLVLTKIPGTWLCLADYLKKFLESSNLALSLPWPFRAWNVPKFLRRTRRFCFSSLRMVLRTVFRILLERAFERPCSLDMASLSSDTFIFVDSAFCFLLTTGH